MDDRQQPQVNRIANQHESILIVGVVRVGKYRRAMVSKDSRCFLERDAVFLQVNPGLFSVPCENSGSRQVENLILICQLSAAS